MRKFITLVSFVVFMCSGIGAANATIIEYTLNDLGAGKWEYAYTVNNDSALMDFSDFVIYFPDVSSTSAFDYSNITVTGNPDSSNWDIIAAQPSAINLGGYIDAAALLTPLAANASVSGFTVSFDYFGTSALGSQKFDIFDQNYNLIDSGSTILGQVIHVPEPTTLFLMGAGFFSLLYGKRKDTA